MRSCSILIRGYNEEEHIGRLLSGILQQTVKDVQIILVDSGSTDATLSAVRTSALEGFKNAVNNWVGAVRSDPQAFAAASNALRLNFS